MSLTRFKDIYPSLFDYDGIAPFDSILDKWFRGSFPEFYTTFGIDIFKSGAYPKVNIIDNEDNFLVEAEIVGLEKDDLEVKVQNDILSIRGCKQEEKEEKGKFILRELKRSSFCRKFKLDSQVCDLKNVNAKYENNILTVTIPKISTSKQVSDSETVEIK